MVGGPLRIAGRYDGTGCSEAAKYPVGLADRFLCVDCLSEVLVEVVDVNEIVRIDAVAPEDANAEVMFCRSGGVGVEF